MNRIYLGRADGAGWGFKRPVKVYANVELSTWGAGPGPWQTVEHEILVERPVRFTITFDVVSSGGRIVECGAMGEEGLDVITDPVAAPHVFEALRRLIPWHLNDTNAGCAHQDVVWEDHPYGRRPSLTLTEPCPLTGYRYGAAWLCRPLTPEALADCTAVGLNVDEPVTTFSYS